MPYCPNCHADLKGRTDTCWNCKALFTGNAAWQPTAEPLGEFRKFPEVKEAPAKTPKAPAKPMNPFLSILLRAFVSLLVFVPLTLVVGLLGVIGGSQSSEVHVVGLAWTVVGTALLVWVCWPLFRLVK